MFFFAEVGCIYGAAEIDPFPFAFLIPFVYFFNLIDAWRSATAHQQPLPRRPGAARGGHGGVAGSGARAWSPSACCCS